MVSEICIGSQIHGCHAEAKRKGNTYRKTGLCTLHGEMKGELGRWTVTQSIVSHFQFSDRTIVRRQNFNFVAQCVQNSSCQEKQYQKYNEKYIIGNKILYFFDLSVFYTMLHGDILHSVKNSKAVDTKRRALQKAPYSGYGICWNFWVYASSVVLL